MKLIAKFWLDNGAVIKEKMSFNKTHIDEVERWIDTASKNFGDGKVRPGDGGMTLTVGHTAIHMHNIVAMELRVR